MIQREFVKCEACEDTKTLCNGCLANRNTIDQFRQENGILRSLVEAFRNTLGLAESLLATWK